MRLNKKLKASFVRAVINDIPTTDYRQQLRDELRKINLVHLPEKVREIAEDDKLSHFLNIGYTTIPGSDSAHYCERSFYSIEQFTKKEREKLSCIARKAYKQDRDIRIAKESLSASVAGISTLKQLREVFPEMEKYMPTESEGPLKHTPAVTDTVSKLVALGWPKDKK